MKPQNIPLSQGFILEPTVAEHLALMDVLSSAEANEEMELPTFKSILLLCAAHDSDGESLLQYYSPSEFTGTRIEILKKMKYSDLKFAAEALLNEVRKPWFDEAWDTFSNADMDPVYNREVADIKKNEIPDQTTGS